MTPIPPRDELLAIIDDEHAQWDALSVGSTPEQMTTIPLAGAWTFRDLTAHLLAWRQWGLDRLEAAAANQPPPPRPFPADLDSVDAVNLYFHERDAHRSVDELNSAFSASFDRLREIVTRLSDDALSDPHKVPYLKGVALGATIGDRSFFEHINNEHAPELEVWRKAIRGE
jgi:hypothetical protein